MIYRMSDDDTRRPTIKQRETWLCQAIAVACSLTTAAIGLTIATLALGWRHGPMTVSAVTASIAWTGAMSLAVMRSTAKLVGDLDNEIRANQRQRREDQIRDELIDTGELNVRRLSR